MNTVGPVPGENTSRRQEETPRSSGLFDYWNGLARESVPYAQDDRVRRDTEKPYVRALRDVGETGGPSSHICLARYFAVTNCREAREWSL